MSERTFLHLKEKIIKTDAVINLLVAKDSKVNELQVKLKFLFDRYLEKSKEAESLQQKVSTCVSEHEPLKMRVAELECHHLNLQDRYTKFLNSSELKFQTVNVELKSLTKKNKELLKINTKLKEQLNRRCSVENETADVQGEEIDLLKTENEILSMHLDKLTERCEREYKELETLRLFSGTKSEMEQLQNKYRHELLKTGEKVSKLEATEKQLRKEILNLKTEREALNEKLTAVQLEKNLLDNSLDAKKKSVVSEHEVNMNCDRADVESVSDLLREMIDLPDTLSSFGDSISYCGDDVGNCIDITHSEDEGEFEFVNVPQITITPPTPVFRNEDECPLNRPSIDDSDSPTLNPAGDPRENSRDKSVATDKIELNDNINYRVPFSDDVVDVSDPMSSNLKWKITSRKKRAASWNTTVQRLKKTISRHLFRSLVKYFRKNLDRLKGIDVTKSKQRQNSVEFRRNRKLLRLKMQRFREIYPTPTDTTDSDNNNMMLRMRKVKCKLKRRNVVPKQYPNATHNCSKDEGEFESVNVPQVTMTPLTPVSHNEDDCPLNRPSIDESDSLTDDMMLRKDKDKLKRRNVVPKRYTNESDAAHNCMDIIHSSEVEGTFESVNVLQITPPAPVIHNESDCPLSINDSDSPTDNMMVRMRKDKDKLKRRNVVPKRYTNESDAAHNCMDIIHSSEVEGTFESVNVPQITPPAPVIHNESHCPLSINDSDSLTDNTMLRMRKGKNKLKRSNVVPQRYPNESDAAHNCMDVIHSKVEGTFESVNVPQVTINPLTPVSENEDDRPLNRPSIDDSDSLTHNMMLSMRKAEDKKTTRRYPHKIGATHNVYNCVTDDLRNNVETEENNQKLTFGSSADVVEINVSEPHSQDSGYGGSDATTKIVPRLRSARHLFKRLLHFGNEAIIVDQVANGFAGQNQEHVASLILSEVCLYTSEAADTKYTPPAPLLTQTQRLLLGFMHKLDNSSMPGLLECFLRRAEKTLLVETDLERLQPVTRLYVAVCKLKKDLDRMRRTVCDALYFMGDFVIPFLFDVLSTWIEVLPLQIDSADDVLLKVLIQVVNLKTCNVPGYNLIPLRKLLNKYYGYPMERWNSDEVFREVLRKYLDNPNKSNEYTVLILCKNHSAKWILQRIEHLKEIAANSDSVRLKIRIVTLIVYIASQLNRDEVPVSTETWLTSLLNDQTPPDLRDCIRKCQELL